MERLTAREKGIAYYPHCFREDTCGGMGPDITCEGCEFSISVCERLASYEDIGLTPEQLQEIDNLYREKCEEVAKLKEQLAAVQKESVTYDMQKIIGQLEELQKTNYEAWEVARHIPDKCGYINTAHAYGNAIKIIKENEGINNDFCEWKLVDTSKDKMPYIKYETNCGFKYGGIWYREPYCPHCGKKIKGIN